MGNMKKQNKKADKKSVSFFKTNKKILAGTLAALLLALAAAAIIVFSPSKNFTVAFYRIDDSQRKGISEVITNIAKEKNIAVKFLQYESEKSLEDQIPIAKKPAVIITQAGFALETALDKASPKALLSSEISQGMTSSMRSGIKEKDGLITAIPFLSSHFEVDIDLNEFRNSNTKQVNTWNDVEKFMREQKRKKDSPMIFAGGNPDSFLNLMGAFAESIDGAQSYYDASQILKDNQKNFNAVRVAQKLCDEPDSPLATSVKLLKSWYKLGLIHQGAFSLQNTDVEAFASNRLASVLFMSLEEHRATATKTISRYSSIYFPSEHGANSRIFTGKTYYAVPMIKSKKAAEIIAALLSVQSQECLSRVTGLAPVLAQCRIPDKQAEDARFWVAATTCPLAGLSSEVYMTKKQKEALSAEIASRIKN